MTNRLIPPERMQAVLEGVERLITVGVVRHRAVPLLDVVAAKLRLSSPTLRRYLQTFDTNYQTLSDRIRLDMAQALLRQGVKQREVATLLGFRINNDGYGSSSFSRFFMQKTGESATTYQARYRTPTLPHAILLEYLPAKKR